MSLLKLLKKGSILTDYDGTTPPSYDRQTNYPNQLDKSQLDLDGKRPLEYNRQSNYVEQLAKSQLDLDGKTPEKYLDNLPE